MAKLSQDHKEMLGDLLSSEAWDAVLALCEVLVSKQEQAVLKVDISQGSRNLTIQKARLDGARSLVQALSRAKADLKEGD